jgi:predicted ribosome quality control (RQC) complex YloA/Tae2 family protein
MKLFVTAKAKKDNKKKRKKKTHFKEYWSTIYPEGYSSVMTGDSNSVVAPIRR